MRDFFEQHEVRRILRFALVMFLALIVQDMLLTGVRPMGVHPFILSAVAVSVGMFNGITEGVIFGLVMGFFADMAFPENTILFTVLFPALSFLTSYVSEFYMNRRFVAYMGVAFVASFLTAVAQMLLTAVGDAWSLVMLKTVLLQTLWSIPFAAVCYFPAAKWIAKNT